MFVSLSVKHGAVRSLVTQRAWQRGGHCSTALRAKEGLEMIHFLIVELLAAPGKEISYLAGTCPRWHRPERPEEMWGLILSAIWVGDPRR